MALAIGQGTQTAAVDSENARPNTGAASPSRWRRFPLDAAVLLGYGLTAFLYLGLPLLTKGGLRYVGPGADPTVDIWSFGWWPDAILQGRNPFFTDAIFAPVGINLMWATSVPGLALLFAPLTLAAGPVVSYDVAAILMPALSAWTAFLLCRYVTRSVLPSIVGGYLFGFSSYVLAQDAEGHLHLTAVFPLPLIALVILRFLDGKLTGRGVAIRLGLLLALLLLSSTEVVFTATLALLAALALAFALLPARRARLRALWPGLLGAYGIAAVLTAPFDYYIVTGLHTKPIGGGDSYIADLANIVVPTSVTLVHGWGSGLAARFPGNIAEQDSYFGVPTLVIVGLYAWGNRRRPTGRFLAAALVVGLVASLGAWATVGGDRVVKLPWALVHHLPVFNSALTTRFAAYVSLAIAVVVALWMTARRPGVIRWLLPLLAVVAIIPDPSNPSFSSRDITPSFFTSAAYRDCLDRGEIILPLPIGQGSAMVWQSRARFRFRMAGGYIGPIPPSFLTPQKTADITMGLHLGPDMAGAVRDFIAANHVQAVVVADNEASFFTGSLEAFGPPVSAGGVELYQLEPAPPSCPTP